MRSSPLLHIVTRPPLIARVRRATRCSKGRVRVGLRVRVSLRVSIRIRVRVRVRVRIRVR